MSRPRNRDARRSDKIKIKFKPTGPSIRVRGRRRPQELGPVPFYDLQRSVVALGIRVHADIRCNKQESGAFPEWEAWNKTVGWNGATDEVKRDHLATRRKRDHQSLSGQEASSFFLAT